MFLLNAITTRVRDRYILNDEITFQSTAAIPTPARHELTNEIESALYSASSATARSSLQGQSSPPSSPPSSPISSPQRPSPLSKPHSNSYNTSLSPGKRRRQTKVDIEKQEKQLMVIKDLNKTIYRTKEAMGKMRESEDFLDTRIRKYRSLLDQQSVKLCSRHLIHGNDHIIVQNKHDGEGATSSGDVLSGGVQYSIDVEKEADIKKQFQQQEKNEKKLSAVLDVQRSILTEIEIMRRKLIDLEQRRDSLVQKQEECEDFLILSAELDMQNEALAHGSLHVSKVGESAAVDEGVDDHHKDNDFVTDEDLRKVEMTALNKGQNSSTPSSEII